MNMPMTMKTIVKIMSIYSNITITIGIIMPIWHSTPTWVSETCVWLSSCADRACTAYMETGAGVGQNRGLHVAVCASCPMRLLGQANASTQQLCQHGRPGCMQQRTQTVGEQGFVAEFGAEDCTGRTSCRAASHIRCASTTTCGAAASGAHMSMSPSAPNGSCNVYI
jgi:hypothetical protein